MASVKTEMKPVRAIEGTSAVNKSIPSQSLLNQTLRLLSSVRFGIVMLVVLLLCCMVGMLIMQQNVAGFQQYYNRLTPAQRSLYSSLGLFDIYHAWYFTGLLAITALNIILSSMERFPAAWQYIRNPKLVASTKFINAQNFSVKTDFRATPAQLAERVSSVWRQQGLRPRVSSQEGSTTVFAQRNVWNRMGAYLVHLALLMIFVGGFLTGSYGTGGVIDITPGESANSFHRFDTAAGEHLGSTSLPFIVDCTDLRQELIRPEGGLDVMNTIDWLSFIRIKDGDREVAGLVHLNSPFDYRGYRFFQSSFQPQGYARQITVTFKMPDGQLRDFTIERNGSVDVEGQGRVSFAGFYPDFTFEGGAAETASGDYNNPVAELEVTPSGGKPRREFAFNAEMLTHSPQVQPALRGDSVSQSNNRILLKSFEKVALSHTLTVQYDPGRTPVYAGFILLVLSLCGVFFFSHQRSWAVIESTGNGSRIYIGGNTNRNRPAFEARFNSLVQATIGGRDQQ